MPREGGVAQLADKGGRAPFLGHCSDSRGAEKTTQSDSNPCSLGLSATSQQYFSLTTNQPPATSQQYSSLRTN
jgi:hypothetical protein